MLVVDHVNDNIWESIKHHGVADFITGEFNEFEAFVRIQNQIKILGLRESLKSELHFKSELEKSNLILSKENMEIRTKLEILQTPTL